MHTLELTSPYQHQTNNMDILQQTKLTREEWLSIEKPVSQDEKRILELIRDGYQNVNHKTNYTQNMFGFTKLEKTPEIEYFLYEKYFYPVIKTLIKKYGTIGKQLEAFTSSSKKIKKLRSIEALRIQNSDAKIQENKAKIYEFVLLEYCEKICKGIHHKKRDYIMEMYTLVQWKKNAILYNIQEVIRFVDIVIEIAKKKTPMMVVVSQALPIIEKNKGLLQYEDLKLFSHQKELFTLCRMHKERPKLLLYIAPTGTGKTLSPIGLSVGHRIIFVCVARHIGLALAKSAISIEKKVAFAFGCTTADDIRLHYYSAVDYTRNKRTGGIGKVDNSNGREVEIMICDVQSYLCAMYYMLAFNDDEDLITYWDEPTISMDYETHELHEVIHNNWRENKIPNVVLSCATLPKEYEIQDVMQDFSAHFPNALVQTITSYDCRKSIPIITKQGYSYLPHTQFASYDEVCSLGGFCENNKTMLRYFDLAEVVKFIGFVHVYEPEEDDEDEDNNKPNSTPVRPIIPGRYRIDEYFSDVSEITMDSLKVYYLKLLQNIEPAYWEDIYESMCDMRQPRFKRKPSNALRRTYSVQSVPPPPPPTPINRPFEKTNSESEVATLQKAMLDDLKGMLLTTEDAHTLTDGPTIYLVDDVTKLAKFFIDHSDISDRLLKEIMEKIEQNEKIAEKLEELEAKLEEQLQKADNSDKTQPDSKKKGEKTKVKAEAKTEAGESLQFNVRQLYGRIQQVHLDPEYMPNSIDHQEKWSPEPNKRAFKSRIESSVVKQIMALNIDSAYKVLTLMGVGVLVKQQNTNYEEIVKRLAQEQYLYVILTTSDYIYGTNYQFCHGFIGEDLHNMTQQKTLQSMGRIGRNNIQQEYTVRFRDDKMIDKLFRLPEVNLEAVNMNKLFCH